MAPFNNIISKLDVLIVRSRGAIDDFEFQCSFPLDLHHKSPRHKLGCDIELNNKKRRKINLKASSCQCSRRTSSLPFLGLLLDFLFSSPHRNFHAIFLTHDSASFC